MHDGIGRSIDWNDNFFAFQHEDFHDIDWVPWLMKRCHDLEDVGPKPLNPEP